VNSKTLIFFNSFSLLFFLLSVLSLLYLSLFFLSKNTDGVHLLPRIQRGGRRPEVASPPRRKFKPLPPFFYSFQPCSYPPSDFDPKTNKTRKGSNFAIDLPNSDKRKRKKKNIPFGLDPSRILMLRLFRNQDGGFRHFVVDWLGRLVIERLWCGIGCECIVGLERFWIRLCFCVFRFSDRFFRPCCVCRCFFL